jgi:biopolymer transport protein ExbB
MRAIGRMGRKRTFFLLMLAFWAIWGGWMAVNPPRASAQDQKPAEKAAAPAPASESGEKAIQPKGFVSWPKLIMDASGWIGFFILLLSIYFVSTVGRMFFELRIPIAMPPDILLRCEENLQKRDFQGVFNVVKDNDSFFSRAVTTGISELPNGLPEAREAMERVGDAVTVELEKKISMLAVLGTLGPMIGLLGTLMGMIMSFGVIAQSDVQMKASDVADGIMRSLVLTFEGVGLAVPAIYFFALFRNRVAHISVTTMVAADHFLRQFAHAARRKQPGGPPPVGTNG